MCVDREFTRPSVAFGENSARWFTQLTGIDQFFIRTELNVRHGFHLDDEIDGRTHEILDQRWFVFFRVNEKLSAKNSSGVDPKREFTGDGQGANNILKELRLVTRNENVPSGVTRPARSDRRH
jgi:hypothetical protein